ncbi:hypothetical protein [Nocardioides sp. B-3]|uniref:hypothetical protein n=1 Tax=Nocardioides sp. B-3 TaxID=2895565 RepID=UPI002153A5FC|nr:hypothetical protein [Nocardioides sp. B-3]UUZ58300.1 hypothetical protein LP418_19005 [Nocardioides sp. B-3]
MRPGGDPGGRKWKLRVSVQAPPRAAPEGRLLVHKHDGTVGTRALSFDRRGRARALVPFSSAAIAAISVSFANVSTRFRCGKDTDFACHGKARDDDQKFVVTTRALKKR